MQIVTITCKDDFDLCLWQLQSMDKFLDTCRINIVINEKDSYVKVCKKKIEKISTKHKIKVWSQQDILKTKAPHFNGWVTQQLLKLLIPIEEDYICLDCKDIFIKHTNIKDLAKIQNKKQPDPRTGQPWCRFYDSMINVLYKYYKTRINSKHINGIQTPRYIKKRVVKEIPKIWNNQKSFIKWWGKFGMPSEFILYDAIELYIGATEKKHNKFDKEEIIAFWYKEQLDFNAINEHARIVKIHRRVFNDSTVQTEVIDFLKNILTK